MTDVISVADPWAVSVESFKTFNDALMEILSECVVHTMYLMNDCRQQADFFYDHINAAIEVTAATHIVKVSTSDRAINAIIKCTLSD